MTSLWIQHPTGAGIALEPAGASASGEVIVQLDPVAWNASDALLSERLGGQVISRINGLRSLRLGLLDGEPVAAAIQRISVLPNIDLVEPNHLLKAASVPNDPYYPVQESYLGLIDATSAWDIEPGDDAVTVAVLDSGVDVTHPDLDGAIFVNGMEVPGNEIDDDGNGCIDDVSGCSFVSMSSLTAGCELPLSGSVRDDNGHGTFVSGIIAAQSNNGIGISGAAPGVKVLPIKILDCEGGGTAADAAMGLLYAARMGARVANISFGADGVSQTLTNAIHEAHHRYSMVVVAATGNDGQGAVSFPASLMETLAVAASGVPGSPDVRPPYSAWGPQVDVAAPGTEIISTVPAYLCGIRWSCLDGQPYATSSGTSFAAPLVSALAALIVSREPFLSPERVRNMIAWTAQPLADGETANWDGAGRIRMPAALRWTQYYLGAPGTSR